MENSIKKKKDSFLLSPIDLNITKAAKTWNPLILQLTADNGIKPFWNPGLDRHIIILVIGFLAYKFNIGNLFYMFHFCLIIHAYICFIFCEIGNQGEIGFQSQARYRRHGSSRNKVWRFYLLCPAYSQWSVGDLQSTGCQDTPPWTSEKKGEGLERLFRIVLHWVGSYSVVSCTS